GFDIVVSAETAIRRSATNGAVSAGSAVCTVDPRQWVRVQIRKAGAPAVPDRVRASHAVGWLELTADPAPLLGIQPVANAVTSAELLTRRTEHVADVQEHYYFTPPRIERGWRHHLVSTVGRSYLDMVNNVAVVGHSHPRLADEVSRQFNLLNT